MEARIKSELQEFPSAEEPFSDAGRKVKTEPMLPAVGQHEHNDGMSNAVPQRRPQCRCRIDLSSPDTLERDFYAWLKGSEPATGTVPCLFASSSVFDSGHSTDHKNLEASPFLTTSHHIRWDVPNSGSSASSDCLSSHSSISPGNCSSANSSTSASWSSNSSCSASSCASSADPFAPSVMPLSHVHFHQPNHNHHQNIHPFFHQQPHYRLMITSCVDQHQKHHPSAMSSSTSSLNATTKIVQISGTRMRRKRNVDKASGRGTNLYGRSYCPGRPLSMEERSQIIHLFHGGMKVNAISKQLCISHGCVSKIITRFRETGNLMPSSHSECRRRKRQQQQQQQMMDPTSDDRLVSQVGGF